jgi:hypothetical protein
VTGITSQTIVTVAVDTSMVIIRTRFFMTIQAVKYAEISCRCMALVAIRPFALVLTAVNWKILCVMVPSGW